MASRTQPRHGPCSVSDHAVLGMGIASGGWWSPSQVQDSHSLGWFGVGRGIPHCRYSAEEAESSA